ncbi:ParB/RepB/Spo0J family partition protein [Poseidonibacter ostreae]|uniref:ParB-like N-terminal domain-containing protein n=1 Tax=Poseidonibacter ostreae TaxID=2654171 RepID=A0A6L4WPB1_9BACT|nr:ParB N-terminal domain-containing protein [Poseidonibacter ostreae]KAB7884625.1 hypothetical protein GA417_11020 [Poseidonibacter ostreae]KAB7885718.1 hypothetical protein GBG19_13530 [Poseidonibacter ostreae]KAB7887916.1 hypothetical protein GBG18_13575 [Poseidonibacter ostreae]
MKPTNKMNINELLEEKESLEKKEKKNNQEKARLKKLLQEITKKNNKVIITDTFTNDSMQNDLKLQYINIKDIVMPKYDDRSGIDKARIISLAESIKNNGLIQHPVLKDLGDGTYEKKVGRRRILATKHNGNEKILAKILPLGLTDEEEDFIIWDENNQREDLNLYDKIRFHLRFICRKFELLNDAEAIKLINNCHFFKKPKATVSDENRQKVIDLEKFLVKLGSYKSVSSLMNNLQVLNFDEFILDAMKESKISYKLAYLLNKSIEPLKVIYNNNEDEVQREIDFVISSEYSVTEAEKYISGIIKNNTPKDEVEIKFNKTIKKLNRKLNKTTPEDREKVIKSIDDLLKSL